MGVYINIEMPQKTYAHCMLIKDIDGSVQLHVCTKNSEEISEWERYDLVPVPPHGRCVDADKLMQEMRLFIKENMLSRDDARELLETLEDAPTIIPAEEGE